MLSQELRPFQWRDVIDQDKIVKGVQNFLKKDDLSSVIGFIGTSGTGKSTMARLLSMTINCTNKRVDKETGFIEPCCNCPSCKSIMNETYGRDVHVFNGSDINVDNIKKIEDIISYNPMFDPNIVILIEESQLVKELKRFLQIVEVPRKNVYWFLTSTDSDKFGKISYDKSNASQEQKAMISRMTRYNVQPISTDSIANYLFKVLEKIDPDEKIPDIFIDEGLQLIAKESKNSLRLALSDFQTCINSECYSSEDVRTLLGYMDNEKESEQVLKMLQKDPSAFTYMQNSNDLAGNVPYWAKILTDARIREVTKVPFNEQWKENSAQMMIATHNVEKLLNAFTKSTSLCGAYFNPTIFYACICEYYDNNSTMGYNAVINSVQSNNATTITSTPTLVKKVKKVAKV